MLKKLLLLTALTGISTLTQAADLKPFTAVYETSYGILSAQGERKLEPLANDEWKLQSNAHVMNFDINENATFALNKTRLQPRSYNFENPFNKSRSQALTFDWSNNAVADAINKTTVALAPNAYDKLSYQLQLQLDVCANPDKFTSEDFAIVDRKKLKTYRVEMIGRDTLKTAVGTLNTIHLRQYRPDKRDDKDTEIWLAADFQCVLVRLDQYDNDDLYTLKLVSAKVAGKDVAGK